MRNVSVVHWDTVPKDGDGPIIRKRVDGRATSLKRVEIPPDTKADRHSHPHEQFVLILEGIGSLQCEIGDVELRPGTVIHFAPGAWHSAHFQTKTVLLEVNLQPVA